MRQAVDFWNKAAESKNLRNEWLCDENVSDEECFDQILPYIRGVTTLDLGCGPGRLTLNWGVDISRKMIALAKTGRYRLTDGETIPFPDRFFHSVYSLFLFQHITDDNKLAYIKEVWRVLKPEGVFRLQFVNRGDKGRMSFPIEDAKMRQLITSVGFKIEDFDHAIYPQWSWLTALK